MLNIAIAAEFDLSEKIIEQLELSNLEIGKLAIAEIFPLEEEQNLRFKGKSVESLEPAKIDWSGFDYVFFAGNIEHLEVIVKATENGCIIIDMKGICSALSGVPIIVPGINDDELENVRQRNIVSLPDPQVSQLALAISPILLETHLDQIFVTSLLPASYTNSETVNQLAGQTARLLNGIPLNDEETRLAFDVYPNQKFGLSQQLQRLFPQVDNIVFHGIQVPVFYGLSQKVSAVSDFEIQYQPEENEFIKCHETLITPVLNGENETHSDEVKMHLSQISVIDNTIEFWSVADEQRFNIALLAVKLLERF